MKRIECIIMDWAGTAVDYGCFAPVAAFVESFRAIGVPVTAAETRAHMGRTKKEKKHSHTKKRSYSSGTRTLFFTFSNGF